MKYKLAVLSRRVHYWLYLLVVLPFLMVTVTGLLLIWKKEMPWVQPTEAKTTAKDTMVVSFDTILALARTQPQLAVQSWADVSKLEVRPHKGIIKLIAENGWELQLNSHTGAVLHLAYRRSDWIEALHDGSYFGAKHTVFFASGVGMLLLLVTGTVLFLHPRLVHLRRRMKRKRANVS